MGWRPEVFSLGRRNRELHAERIPSQTGTYGQALRIDGRELSVNCTGDFSYVSVTLPSGTTDFSLLEKIAQRFDAELATGKYDTLFVKPVA